MVTVPSRAPASFTKPVLIGRPPCCRLCGPDRAQGRGCPLLSVGVEAQREGEHLPGKVRSQPWRLTEAQGAPTLCKCLGRPTEVCRAGVEGGGPVGPWGPVPPSVHLMRSSDVLQTALLKSYLWKSTAQIARMICYLPQGTVTPDRARTLARNKPTYQAASGLDTLPGRVLTWAHPSTGLPPPSLWNPSGATAQAAHPTPRGRKPSLASRARTPSPMPAQPLTSDQGLGGLEDLSRTSTRPAPFLMRSPGSVPSLTVPHSTCH